MATPSFDVSKHEAAVDPGARDSDTDPRDQRLEPGVAATGGTRIVRVGLLGLGRVGQSIARLAARGAAATPGGLRLRVDGALVRHVTAPRRCPRPARTTSNPSAFLRGDYDVVIEALGGLEPARTLVARLLGRGIPVVTANARLVAAYGAPLAALAEARGTTLRAEASLLAGLPIPGRSPTALAAPVADRFTALVDDKVADAADSLVMLALRFGWGLVDRRTIDITGVGSITASDLEAARTLGGAIRPVVSAARRASGIETFAGPAWLPAAHPLATVGTGLTAIELRDGCNPSRFFSGPPPDADIAAADLVDAALCASSIDAACAAPHSVRVSFAHSPVTPWLVRLSFPGIAPRAAAVRELAMAAGIAVEHVEEAASCAGRAACWLFASPMPRASLDAALGTLGRVHRLHACAIRRLEI